MRNDDHAAVRPESQAGRQGAGGGEQDGAGPAGVEQRLDRIEILLERLLSRQASRDWYSTAELAELLGKAEFTVREWCRLGRLNAVKKASGRGKHPAWAISHGELLRYQREGLLPDRKT